MSSRIDEIREKGLDMYKASEGGDETYVPLDFTKLKIGKSKPIADPIFDNSNSVKGNNKFLDKDYIQKAILNNEVNKLRDVSNYFYRESGIYARLCKYLAFLYRYDTIATPYFLDDKDSTQKKVLDAFNDLLLYVDNFNPKKVLGEIALKTIRNGVYYGYLVRQTSTQAVIQELPIKYCRVRFYSGKKPVVEFNMRYFDDKFSDVTRRIKVIKAYPPEFAKGYSLYKQGKLQGESPEDGNGWYILDIKNAIKFNINGEDFPPLISVIPAIIDLDNAKDLDMKKTAQELMHVLIQKMPIDKNGEPIFDIEEAKTLQKNAVKMIGDALGIRVLTTFADTSLEDVSEPNASTKQDQLERIERALYNESGTAQNLFNASGNLTLEKSILNDEASILNLILQFEEFLNELISIYNKNPKKYYFKIQILPTTIYNYKEMSKLFKEQTQLGYSKMLPPIALGQTQSATLANAYFENNVLNLVTVFVPPLNTNVLNADSIQNVIEKSGGSGKIGSTPSSPGKSNEGAGRPEKANDEKSDKTIKNIESQS